MSTTRFLTAIILIMALSFSNHSCKKDDPSSTDDTADIITDAYIYGYPLLIMKITADKSTNVLQTTNLGFAPFNQFSHRNKIPDYNFTSVVSPNVDTFYSSAMLDLEEEPVVLSVPDATLFKPDNAPWRYYVMQLMDAWSNVFEAPGVRTTGTGAQSFLISGPNWSGSVPGGMTHYESPTRLVWLLGRVMVKDSADIATVIAFQQEVKLMPLSAWPGPYTPPNGQIDNTIDMVTAPVDQVAALSVEEYFQMLCDMMVDNPAATYDAEMVQKMAKVGISPGGTFDLSSFSESKQKAIKTGYSNGQLKLENLENTIDRTFKNGWVYVLDDIGAFMDDYDLRAYTANVGFGANLAEDGVYPLASMDKESVPFNNSYEYTITFPAGQTPPQQGFWSITMYNASHFLTQNPIKRYAIGSYSNYQLNNDNSLTLYIQKDSPGIDKESNWLPTPQGDNSAFYLMMRIYWPDQSVLDNIWEIPGVVRVN